MSDVLRILLHVTEWAPGQHLPACRYLLRSAALEKICQFVLPTELGPELRESALEILMRVASVAKLGGGGGGKGGSSVSGSKRNCNRQLLKMNVVTTLVEV